MPALEALAQHRSREVCSHGIIELLEVGKIDFGKSIFRAFPCTPTESSMTRCAGVRRQGRRRRRRRRRRESCGVVKVVVS
jgi:hypothetical protein